MNVLNADTCLLLWLPLILATALKSYSEAQKTFFLRKTFKTAAHPPTYFLCHTPLLVRMKLFIPESKHRNRPLYWVSSEMIGADPSARH